MFERLFAALAMVMGGIFYGFMLGHITSTITGRDLNRAAYNDRLERVRAWLHYHHELPIVLRRRVKRYFQQHLTLKPALDDSVILNDLSPALATDICYFLAPEEMRCNLLFKNLPMSIFAQIMPILENT